MECAGRLICAIIGFSASYVLLGPRIDRRRQQRRIAAEKLRITSEALERAEERAAAAQERHDRILGQLCSFYLSHRELEDALAAARIHLNDATEFAAGYRTLQMNIVRSYPDYI